MKKINLILAIFVLVGTVQAQDIRITKIDFATSIEDRKPVGVDTTFAADIGTVFCFTMVEGVTDTSQIAHVWYYKDQEKARINLKVKSKKWRTWSSKQIQKSWIGSWRVMIEDSNGNVLATKTFEVEG